MDFSALKRYQPYITPAVIVFFMIIALILRIIPAIVTRDLAFFPIYDTDTWYNLRQIEVMVHHFPHYNWFDPMTAYPGGKIIDWGPLYPFLAALFCIVTGAMTRDAIISAAGFVSPLMAVLMVVVIYSLGSAIADRKTGIIAAGLIVFSSFLYFTFSSYGMVDHHIAEVLFSTIFILVYLSALSHAEAHPPGRNNLNATAILCGLSALAGLLYFSALITSTTALLVLLVIAVYTFVQNAADFLHAKDPDYLCFVNLVTLGFTMALLVVFGFRQDGFSIMNYSPGLVLVHGAIAAETIVLYIVAKLFRGKRTHYVLVLAGLITGGIILSRIVPALQQVSHQALDLVSGDSVFSIGVQETLPWSFAGAYDALNVAILLVAGGFLVLAYRLVKKPDRGLVFFAVWSIIMLLLTLRFQRFLYYFTVNSVLLCALCIAEPFRWNHDAILHRLFPAITRFGGTVDGKPPVQEQPARTQAQKRKKNTPAQGNVPGIKSMLQVFCLLAVCILAVMHCGLSLSQDYHYAAHAGERVIPPDWLESLEWLRSGTPDPGIGYFDKFEKSGYQAPADSYGILAVWDAGHWITFFSHRTPVTNPFQDNLGGRSGTASFFLSGNETEANEILKKFGGRYVITDSTMAVDRFTNLVPWSSGSADISLYIKWFLVPDPADPAFLKKTHKFDNGYFQTMVVRLHNFDGSLTEPSDVEYTEYTIRLPKPHETAEATGYSRVITGGKTVTVSGPESIPPVIPEGPELLPAAYAAIYSNLPHKPVQAVPALQHYRLVHESEHDATTIPFPESSPVTLGGIRMVKIFEYVKGARISGTGTIEVPVVTNTGRTFTYRQESVKGKFIVPYTTTAQTGGVHATGPYHLVGTDRYFTVTEEDVTNGMIVTDSR